MLNADDLTAAHIAALSQAVQDMVEIMHRLDPPAVEAKLRSARLFVQETQAGRIEGQDEVKLTAHRLRRDLLERAVAHSREHQSTS